jgi:hypothetical protein
VTGSRSTTGLRLRSRVGGRSIGRCCTPATPRRRRKRVSQVSCGSQLRNSLCNVATLNQIGVSFGHLKCRLLTLAPEANVELVLADAKITHSKVRELGGKGRVDIELVARSVRQKPQYCLREHKYRASRPGLGYVRTKILHREIRLTALGRGIKFRQQPRESTRVNSTHAPSRATRFAYFCASPKEEVTCRHTNIMRDPRRLRMKAIVFEAHFDDGVVVRPDGACLVVVWIKCRVAGSKNCERLFGDFGDVLHGTPSAPLRHYCCRTTLADTGYSDPPRAIARTAVPVRPIDGIATREQAPRLSADLPGAEPSWSAPRNTDNIPARSQK